MTVSIAKAMAAVESVLAAQTSNHVPLVARFMPAEDWEDPSVIEILSENDGRRHVVSVSVDDSDLSVITTVFETTENGGFTFHKPEGMMIGADHASPSKAFMADLLRALDASPDVFEPVSSPGVATHPRTLEMVKQSLIAAEAYNLDRSEDEQISLALNPEGPIDGKDCVCFLKPDGTALPVQIRGVDVYKTDTDELLDKHLTKNAKTEWAEWIGHHLAEPEASAPAP